MMLFTRTYNVDGKIVECQWDSFEEVKADWFGDDYSGPSLDDTLDYGEVDGIEVIGDTFKDVMDKVRERYDFDY